MYNDVYINKFLKYSHNIPYRLIVQTIKIKFVLLKICFIDLMSKQGIKTERANSNLSGTGKFQLSNGRGKGVEYDPKKTIIISGHKDTSLNSTRKMKKALWELFPNYHIDLAYPSSLKGTLTFQFATVREATDVVEAWNTRNFGPGSKVTQPLLEKVYGVLKDTPLEWTDEEAIGLIGAEFGVEYCKRIKSRGKDTHVITVKFKSNLELKKAIDQGLKVGNESLNFHESYGRQRMIIRCYKCQEFGKHLANQCPNKIKCTKCSGEHRQENCSEDKEKCANCKGDHRADSISCTTFQEHKEKVQSFTR